MKDHISDMLTRIRNGQKANLLEINLFWPTPNFCIKILILFQLHGFIRGFKKTVINNKLYITVLLKYVGFQNPIIKKIQRISTSGKRIYSSSRNLWKLNNGLGLFLISTPKGLLTDQEARFLNVGGEVICYIQ